ncbi:sensor histidine kinase [Pyxidicoccus xibeiensis]|uniref:sensor histidine kinase n=1 Tax=Pyxidicoccus xibeiensis TaxID=2906759 RepID=UPI0020A7B309|nr:ATP-binding protein [Pyxidicoccus xibeiensis]MCP3140223.1 ATP-binding protein [Pyxidicoccus xibeiensis]
MRARVLLFALAAVGLVVAMGGALIMGSVQGRRTRDRGIAAEAQERLLQELRLDSALYLQALLDAIETRGSIDDVREAAVAQSDAVFKRIHLLAEEEEEAGGEPSETEAVLLERLREAHHAWLVEVATVARASAPEAEVRFLNEARHAYARDVKPLLLLALQREQEEKAALFSGSNKSLQFAQVLGMGFPVVSVLLVGGLALTMLVPLRRTLREFQAGAERVGQGDFEQLLPEHRADEYGRLARTFNRMARQLQELIAEKQRRAREEAEAAERETRRQNAVLEELVRGRTAELEQANTRLTESLGQLRATQAQLLFADRLASVGQLAAGIGHEINNPLAFIISNLEFVQEELRRRPDSPELPAALAEAREGAERVRLIVRELGNLARPDSMETGPVDLGAVVRSAEKMAMHLIRPRARLVRDVDGAPAVFGNGARLCQVLLNLLLNAAHAIEPGRGQQHFIHVRARAAGTDKVLVEVEDTGCGIAPANLARVFDPFFTTRPVGMGTGLGLAVCHGIVASHGGEISVESEVGKGTTFRVLLPVFARGAREVAHPARVEYRPEGPLEEPESSVSREAT